MARRGRPKKTKTVEPAFSPITPVVEEPVTEVADGPAIVVTPVTESAPLEAPEAPVAPVEEKPVAEAAPEAPKKRRGRPKKTATAVKEEAPKAAPKKRGRKSAAEKAALAAKEEEVKAAPKRRGRKPGSTTKATTAKKPATRGRRKKVAEEAVEETYFQFDGVGDILAEDVKERVKEAYKAEGHRIAMIHSLQIYVNVNEGRAYYVINGKPENKYIDL